MKNKIFIILCIVILSLLCIVSCQDQQKQPEAVPETTSGTEQGTESETVEPDLDLEIAQNYSNTVVSAKKALEHMKKYYQCRSQKYLTYYDTVKFLGSTGKNVSDATYFYEWVLDDGTYLHAQFYLIQDENGNQKELKQSGGIVPAQALSSFCITNYTRDPDLIKSNYPDYSTYLYECFFTEEFESYDEFLKWFGYTEIPEVPGVEIPPYTPEKAEAMEERFSHRPVHKMRALNLKPGMSLYEAVYYLGSLGWWTGGYLYTWKVNNYFFLEVSVVDDEPGVQPYGEIITDVEFHTINPDFVMYDHIKLD